VNNLRVWIGVLSLTWLAAGLGAGVLLGRATAPSARPETVGAFPDYERRMTAQFGISPARREVLRAVLESYAADVERIKDRHMADYMSSIEPELRERGRYYRGLIRDKVLPEGQREAFDQLSLGLPTNRND
jgi:hypothetical protein